MSKPHNHKSKHPDPIKTLQNELVIIPHSPAHFEDDSLPCANSPWPMFVLIGGTIAAGLCLWWFAPDFIKLIFSAVG